MEVIKTKRSLSQSLLQVVAICHVMANNISENLLALALALPLLSVLSVDVMVGAVAALLLP